MKLIIDISEDIYREMIKSFDLYKKEHEKICYTAIANGVLLDKELCNIKNAEWLEHHNQTRFYVKCSNCKTLYDEESNYCPYCGAKMVKSWESEDKYEI